MRSRKDTDCRIWIGQEALVGQSNEEGGLSDSGIACEGQYERRMRNRARIGLTSDDEFEDVIPARTSHTSERVSGSGLERSVASSCQRGTLHRGSLSDTTSDTSFYQPTTMSAATWRQFFTYRAFLKSVTAGTDCCIKSGLTNTPKLLLVQFASRSRRTSGSSLKSEGSPP
jgi:hypothetical protein